MRKTKIVATIGPASSSPEKIRELFKAGMNAARINFSHGSHESHGETINKIKQAREEFNLPIPLILDTKGPEIRTKTLKTEPVELKKGGQFILTTDDCEGDETRVSVTYADITKDLRVGSTVLIDDGLIELKVKEIKGNDVICEVENSGFLGSRKGVNIPDIHLGLPALSEKDIEDIKFGIKMGFDYIAASFIRSADDVKQIRKLLEENGGSSIRIISKIENREGVENLDEILEVTDGIMVARGDLGVEIPLEEVPVIQKNMIRKCKEYGKLVITATQMLESMITNPRPTRAEASDVANAIFDGTDAIMLSGETAKGNYPVEAVETMVKIALRVESSIDYSKKFSRQKKIITDNITDAVGHATCTTANDLNAAGIIAVSKSGFTVNQIAKFRPMCPVYAFTPDEQVRRQLNLLWGCNPNILEDITTSALDLFNAAAFKTFKLGGVKVGDIVVIVGGTPIGIAGNTNTLKVHCY
ncbi:MAG: pyruvate kinase [Clostridiales bacterium]|nr:pyruvate kinase [Clostridiales bacterium]